MDLSEFITTTLVGITEGVKNANKKYYQYFKVRQATEVVTFDIAVSASSESEGKKGGGIKIYVVDAGIGKTDKKFESNVSRIQFTVGTRREITD
jgi:hypothetical protein